MLQNQGAKSVDGENQAVLVVAHGVPWHVARVTERREPFLYCLVKSTVGLVT